MAKAIITALFSCAEGAPTIIDKGKKTLDDAIVCVLKYKEESLAKAPKNATIIKWVMSKDDAQGFTTWWGEQSSNWKHPLSWGFSKNLVSTNSDEVAFKFEITT